MNQEQLKSLVRSFVTMFGGVIAGYFAAKGWLTADQVMDILNSGTFIGVVVSIIMGAWGLVRHTQANEVATVAQMPQVKEITLDRQVEGAVVLNAATPENVVIK